MLSLQPYYYNSQIHNLGNIGIGGSIHALISPIARRMIDIISYNGINIRKEIMINYDDANVLDLCCGIGESTYKFGTGIDTSEEMIAMAKLINKDRNFYIGNAENYKPSMNYDIVTCMFAFHEMPLDAQYKVIDNAIKIAKDEVIIVDIASTYQPKDIMISGEPYLINYLQTIDYILENFNKINYINNHVSVWKYKK